jgi:hypothetical protein
MRFILFFIVISATCRAQNITIKGKAHASHIGKEVILSDFTDYINFNRIKESADTVDNEGYFELKLQSKVTRPVMISIRNLTGKLYVQPNFVYGIYFPAEDSSANHQEGTETTVDISVYGKDSTELNALIIDFNSQYNHLFSKSEGYLSPSKINALLDTFVIATKKRYAQIRNPYFKNYLEYSFANFYSSTSRSKAFLYNQFIDKKPIQYNNYEYMQFFNAYFKGYLKAYASKKIGGGIYNSINAFADYRDLKSQLKEDKSINNDTIHELLILKGLIDFYYSPDFDKHQVHSVIEQLYRETIYPVHKSIAFTILQTINQLQPGAPAPDFVANDRSGMKVNLTNYKGKHIYLNFFSSESETSQKEMQKIVDLKKKFNDKITFISVCLDDSFKSYKTYLKNNPKQDWIILHQAPNSNAKQNYNIKTLSGFFFINPQMQLAQSPALMPSEGIEYKFNALFRPRKKNTIPGVR